MPPQKGFTMRYLKLTILASCLLLLWSQKAYAHAVPVGSTPQANEILEQSPTELEIRYNEPIVPDLSRITVLTQAGQAVATTEAIPLSSNNRTLGITFINPLPDGAYLVSWQVLSAVDGHTTSGSFSFGVGVAELTAVNQETSVIAQTSTGSALARWLTLTGMIIAIGAFAFRLFVWNPILKDVELTAHDIALDQRHAQASQRGVWVGVGLIIVGLIITFFEQNSSYGLLSGNFGTWVATRFGLMWLVRLGLTAVLAILATFLLPKQAQTPIQGVAWWLGLLLGVGLTGTISLISHSAALTRDATVATAVDLTHTLSAGIWVGGLIFLFLALRFAQTIEPETRLWLNLNLNLNFSTLAGLTVGALLLSGGYLATQHVGSWTALVGTAYGIALLIKLGLALVVFLLASINLLWLKPRLSKAFLAKKQTTNPTLLSRFRLATTLEMILTLAIILVIGYLTELQRGIEAPLLADAPGQMSVTAPAEDLNITLNIEPALIGNNTFEIYLEDDTGNPISNADEVALRYTFLGQSIGSDGGTATATERAGYYELEGGYMSLIGTWQVEVSVRRPDAFDTFVPYRLEAGLGGNIRPLDGNAPLLERFAKFMTIADAAGTGVLLILFALIWGFIATRTAKNIMPLLIMLLMSLYPFWLGSLQLFTFFTEDYTPTKFLTNPILPDSQSINIGQSLYEQNCVVCHGEEGYGDGPAAETLPVIPVNFGSGHTASHPDGDLYYWILNGVDNSPMPAFSDTVSEEDAWHLVNYVRRLTAQSEQAFTEGQTPP